MVIEVSREISLRAREQIKKHENGYKIEKSKK
jgi:hypothetical protein